MRRGRVRGDVGRARWPVITFHCGDTRVACDMYRYTNDEADEECDYCRRGECTQAVLRNDDWDSDMVIHLRITDLN